jgi:hypothetical protein
MRRSKRPPVSGRARCSLAREGDKIASRRACATRVCATERQGRPSKPFAPRNRSSRVAPTESLQDSRERDLVRSAGRKLVDARRAGLECPLCARALELRARDPRGGDDGFDLVVRQPAVPRDEHTTGPLREHEPDGRLSPDPEAERGEGEDALACVEICHGGTFRGPMTDREQSVFHTRRRRVRPREPGIDGRGGRLGEPVIGSARRLPSAPLGMTARGALSESASPRGDDVGGWLRSRLAPLEVGSARFISPACAASSPRRRWRGEGGP